MQENAEQLQMNFPLAYTNIKEICRMPTPTAKNAYARQINLFDQIGLRRFFFVAFL